MPKKTYQVNWSPTPESNKLTKPKMEKTANYVIILFLILASAAIGYYLFFDEPELIAPPEQLVSVQRVGEIAEILSNTTSTPERINDDVMAVLPELERRIDATVGQVLGVNVEQIKAIGQ